MSNPPPAHEQVAAGATPHVKDQPVPVGGLPPQRPASSKGRSALDGVRKALGEIVGEIAESPRKRTAALILVTFSGLYLLGTMHYEIPTPPMTSIPFVPTPMEMKPDAQNYCFHVAENAAGLGNVHLIAAAAVTLAVMISGFLAVIFGNEPEAKDALARHRGSFAALIVIIGVPCGLLMYRRSDAADELAAAANDARTSKDDAATVAPASSAPVDVRQVQSWGAYRACSSAWSAWIRSRIESNSIMKVELDEAKRRSEENAKLHSPPTSTSIPTPEPDASASVTP